MRRRLAGSAGTSTRRSRWSPARSWINRGFVPDARKNPATRAEGLVPGTVRITGSGARGAGQGHIHADQRSRGKFVVLGHDLASMTASAFLGGRVATMAQNYLIEADARPEPPGGLPKGGVTRLDLPNRHLEYAITWYGLALTLVGVYAAFARGRWRACAGITISNGIDHQPHRQTGQVRGDRCA